MHAEDIVRAAAQEGVRLRPEMASGSPHGSKRLIELQDPQTPFLEDLLDSGNFADVTVIEPSGTARPLHAPILAMRSNFFRCALFGAVPPSAPGAPQPFAAERTPGQRTVRVGFEDPRGAWPAVLRFLYTGTLAVDRRTACGALALGRALLVEGLEEKCVACLRDMLGPDTCLEILRDACELILDDCGLAQQCVDVAAASFPVVFARNAPGLPFQAALAILRHGQLRAECEEQVLQFVLGRLRDDTMEPAPTSDEVQDLLGEVRFAFLPAAVLDGLARDGPLCVRPYAEAGITQQQLFCAACPRLLPPSAPHRVSAEVPYGLMHDLSVRISTINGVTRIDEDEQMDADDADDGDCVLWDDEDDGDAEGADNSGRGARQPGNFPPTRLGATLPEARSSYICREEGGVPGASRHSRLTVRVPFAWRRLKEFCSIVVDAGKPRDADGAPGASGVALATVTFHFPLPVTVTHVSIPRGGALLPTDQWHVEVGNESPGGASQFVRIHTHPDVLHPPTTPAALQHAPSSVAATSAAGSGHPGRTEVKLPQPDRGSHLPRKYRCLRVVADTGSAGTNVTLARRLAVDAAFRGHLHLAKDLITQEFVAVDECVPPPPPAPGQQAPAASGAAEGVVATIAAAALGLPLR
ncbi:unnamed protein product [Pedinophyceae sp. YPF-701]|nr:unnamed protein product [Pedinophyceae sp. YPF-701]